MVLVVDDETSLRELLRRWLLRAGYDVADVACAADAIERLAALEDRINLLLTDLDMPGIRGEELIATVRARWPRLPIIVLSGYSERVAAIHADGQLDKPIRSEKLVQAIEHAISRALGSTAGGSAERAVGVASVDQTPQPQMRAAQLDDDVHVETLDLDELLDIEEMDSSDVGADLPSTAPERPRRETRNRWGSG